MSGGKRAQRQRCAMRHGTVMIVSRLDCGPPYLQLKHTFIFTIKTLEPAHDGAPAWASDAPEEAGGAFLSCVWDFGQKRPRWHPGSKHSRFWHSL